MRVRSGSTASVDGGNRCGGHFLREILVVDVGDVEGAESVLAHGGVQIFPAKLHVEHVARMMLTFVDLTPVLHYFVVIVGIDDLLQVAAIDRRRIVMLGDGDGFKSLGPFSDVDVAAQRVDQVGALHQQLRHPRVVIALGRNMTTGACFGFLRSDGVRIVGAEGESAETFGGNGLLLVIDPIAISVL